MMSSKHIEDKIYKELSRTDEWVGVDGINSLREKLFGNDEWAGVREYEWMKQYKDRHSWGDFE